MLLVENSLCEFLIFFSKKAQFPYIPCMLSKANMNDKCIMHQRFLKILSHLISSVSSRTRVLRPEADDMP